VGVKPAWMLAVQYLQKGLLLTLLAALTVVLCLAFKPVNQAAPADGVHAGAPGPVSVGFAQDMSRHHEQALDMARLALAQGSPRVAGLAQGIVNQQLKEMGYMQGWLLLWQAAPVAEREDMRWMKDAYEQAGERVPAYEQFIQRCTTEQGMPGLATPAQMEHLASLRGAAFDERFLALMVAHHQAAVWMARFAAQHAESAVVQGFAASVASEQGQELPQMLTQLAALQREPGARP
jgi:uncharacterized protein (DUF305 family)